MNVKNVFSEFLFIVKNFLQLKGTVDCSRGFFLFDYFCYLIFRALEKCEKGHCEKFSHNLYIVYIYSIYICNYIIASNMILIRRYKNYISIEVSHLNFACCETL